MVNAGSNPVLQTKNLVLTTLSVSTCVLFFLGGLKMRLYGQLLMCVLVVLCANVATAYDSGDCDDRKADAVNKYFYYAVPAKSAADTAWSAMSSLQDEADDLIQTVGCNHCGLGSCNVCGLWADGADRNTTASDFHSDGCEGIQAYENNLQEGDDYYDEEEWDDAYACYNEAYVGAVNAEIDFGAAETYFSLASSCYAAIIVQLQ